MHTTGTADYSLALHNLALGLAKDGSKGLPALLARCPRLPTNNSTASQDFQERRFQRDFQNERRCAALLAVCEYVQAAPINERTMAVLEDHLLPYLDQIVRFHETERLKNFPQRFLIDLALLAHHEKFGEKIASSFFQFFQQVENGENPLLLSLFVGALGQAKELPPFDKTQTHELLQKLRSFYRSKFDDQEVPKAQRVKMNILVLQAIRNLVGLRAVVLGQEDFRTLYALGALASEELLVPSVGLCLECAKHNDDLGAQAVKLISSEMMYAVPLFEDNPTENQLTYTTLLRGLVDIGNQHPELVRSVTQKLLDYLLDVHALQKPDVQVRDQAIASLTDIVQQEMESNGTASIRWVLEYLSHALYSAYNEYMRMNAETPVEVRTKKESLLVVIVVSLGRLACQLNDPSISDIVVPTLIGRITYPDLNFDAFIIDQLAEIAVLGQKEVYSQVADLLGNIYKNCLNCPDNMFIHNTIPNAYSRLASGLPADSRLQEDLLLRVFKLFQLIANQIHRKEAKSRTAVLGFLGILLPIMGQILSNPQFEKKSWDPASIKLFSNVWFYCVVYRFAYQQEWTPAWYTAICQIANRLPPLTSEKSTTVLETTLTLESFNMTPQEVNNIKRELSEILARSSLNKGIFTQDTVKQLSFGKCLYLLSVYHLETIRAGQGNLFVLFSYLEESSYDPSMSQAINVIAEQVFQVFLQTMINWNSARGVGENREDILIEVIYVLLLAFVHNEDNVRKAADKYILKLLEAFPQLLWNHKALVTLLDLTQAVSNGAEVQGHATLRLNLPNSDETITLPEDYEGRQSLLNETIELCTVWLQSAKRYAPIETDCVLHEYCQKFQQSSFGFLHHQGFSLIVRMAGMTADSRGDQSTPHYSSKPSASSFVNSLNRKSAYMGEVRGMTILHRDQEIAQLSAQLIEQIKRSLIAMQTGDSFDQTLFHGDICRAAAFVISQQGAVDRQLVHYLCWAPIVAFQELSVSTGVFAWTWLLAARPDLGTMIMHEIQDAWHWSIDQGIGLFNSRIVPPSPLSIKRNAEIFNIYKHLQFYKVVPSDPKPHCVLIDFLQERLTLVRKNNPEQMEIIQNMLFYAIANPQRLSQQASSLAVRFRLLLLCVNFLTEGGHLTEPLSVQVFMERIYAVAVDWFDKSPQWYDPGSRAALDSDVKVLVEFASALDESKPNAFNFPDVSLPQTGIISLVLDNLPSRDGIFSSRRDTTGDGPATTPSAIYKIDAHRTSLLMLLIGHEIDRMSAWHNPQNRLQLKLPDASRYTTERVIHGWQWQRYIRTAWGISPTLAVTMGERFPYPKVHSIISNYVLRDPAQAWTIPAAVNYLAKPENVAIDHPMLSHLLYWAASTPPNALALLGPVYQSHPYITQYAIRVLRSFPADTIVFYIPQLVQAIRYDKSGLVEQYLLSASQHSQVLAHQLIWNMQTYSQDPEKTQYPLAQKAASVRNEIISMFNPVFRKNYENEFEFFERVTALSGDLMAYPKPEQRVVLKDKLREIEITPPLYLPTSPDTTVIAINPEKASPMQSAAKVPILVTFIVTHEPALDRPESLQIKSPERAPRISEVPEEKPHKVRRSTSKKFRKTDPAASGSSTASSSSKHHHDPRSRPKKTKTRTSRAASHVDLKAAEAAAKEAAASSSATTSRTTKARGTRSESQKNLKEELENSSNAVASTPRKKHTKKKRTTKTKGKSTKESRKPTSVVPAEGQVSQACIFKVGDDVRQDMLALQVIELFKRILQSVDMDLFLYPYRVVATTPDCGIIECVPHAQSRDQIGKQVEGSLYDYFRHRYGPENSLEFQNARNNFLKSMAAYSVVSYILQIKDRHNGNMLIDDFGHIVHIDFGFIFDISPGGGLRFERAPFKLSDEMLVLMGGDAEAEPFKWFVEYTAKAYLAVRQHMDSIITLVTLCMDTGFPCFTDQTLSNLRARFCPQKSEKEAAHFIFGVIIEALSSFSTYTTRLYDVFQHWSNGIDY